MAINHFPYQHPVFGRSKRRSTPIGWKRSVYYWWWEYLRRNVDYKATCDNFGVGACADLYEDFGDVFSVDFKTWWSSNDRGAKLFANQSSIKSLEIVTEFNFDSIAPDEILLKVNINIPRKHLETKFKSFLDKNHKGKRGFQDAKKSNALYKFKGQPNLGSLELTLMIYDLRIMYPDLKLWELSKKLPKFQLSNTIGSADSQYEIADKKNRLSASIGRYLARADKAISNVAKGQFP
jgi:hypothetical protein